MSEIDVSKTTFYACIERENEKLKKVLNELVPILKVYAFSTIGEKQADGSYKFVYSKNQFGEELSIFYDPKKAIEGLNIINNVNTAPTTIFDKIKSFALDDFAKFIHSLVKCSENLTCDDCYIASLPFPKRICDTKETLEEIKVWLNEEFMEK